LKKLKKLKLKKLKLKFWALALFIVKRNCKNQANIRILLKLLLSQIWMKILTFFLFTSTHSNKGMHARPSNRYHEIQESVG